MQTLPSIDVGSFENLRNSKILQLGKVSWCLRRVHCVVLNGAEASRWHGPREWSLVTFDGASRRGEGGGRGARGTRGGGVVRVQMARGRLEEEDVDATGTPAGEGRKAPTARSIRAGQTLRSGRFAFLTLAGSEATQAPSLANPYFWLAASVLAFRPVDRVDGARRETVAGLLVESSRACDIHPTVSVSTQPFCVTLALSHFSFVLRYAFARSTSIASLTKNPPSFL
ncbi:hypothetical protein K438DRAFT_1960629 [Mycena galopus ATCC 62051]|nr:hypothetical protein K438DRAFT_1960629 [Mycena galopus ATCC 62051]